MTSFLPSKISDTSKELAARYHLRLGVQPAQDGYKCGPTQIVNLLKTLWDFFFVIMCRNVLNVWPKTTLPPVWGRDAKRLDAPGWFYHFWTVTPNSLWIPSFPFIITHSPIAAWITLMLQNTQLFSHRLTVESDSIEVLHGCDLHVSRPSSSLPPARWLSTLVSFCSSQHSTSLSLCTLAPPAWNTVLSLVPPCNAVLIT